MNNSKHIETEEQLIQALEEFFCDVTESEDVEILDKELIDFGYDPSKLMQKGRDISNRLISDSPLNWRNTANKEIIASKGKLNKIKSGELTSFNRESLLNEIQKILDVLGQKNPRFIPAHFRNFETASESDLLSILNELKYLSTKDGNDREH